jgi:hypothetical protein
MLIFFEVEEKAKQDESIFNKDVREIHEQNQE